MLSAGGLRSHYSLIWRSLAWGTLSCRLRIIFRMRVATICGQEATFGECEVMNIEMKEYWDCGFMTKDSSELLIMRQLLHDMTDSESTSFDSHYNSWHSNESHVYIFFARNNLKRTISASGSRKYTLSVHSSTFIFIQSARLTILDSSWIKAIQPRIGTVQRDASEAPVGERSHRVGWGEAR